MKEYGYWLDIMAVSCDSFDEEINKKIGTFCAVFDESTTLWEIDQFVDKNIAFDIHSTQQRTP